ncbi:hypothetical protein DYY67_0064 [Candidatus Nitrosotalea sp. TS]|nr:hypothetical protein [Candidatus Nitrosotalea sp. TS]
MTGIHEKRAILESQITELKNQSTLSMNQERTSMPNLHRLTLKLVKS